MNPRGMTWMTSASEGMATVRAPSMTRSTSRWVISRSLLATLPTVGPRVLVGPGETWDVAFKADNPGIWMLHCHVLGHAVAGMSMTINYQGISTPFTMGVRSGNVPE